MITVVMTKIGDDCWYRIKTIKSVEQIFAMCEKNKGDLCLRKNWVYEKDPEEIIEFWDGMSLEDAKIVSECKFEVEFDLERD